jgi:hypothetical protein
MIRAVMRHVPRFALLVDPLRDIACEERHRLGLLGEEILKGSGIEPEPKVALAGLRVRLSRIDGVIRLLGLLLPHEGRVRMLFDEGEPPADIDPPTLWRC